MERTRGRPEIRIGLIDGPVAVNHPDLVTENIRALFIPVYRAGQDLIAIIETYGTAGCLPAARTR